MILIAQRADPASKLNLFYFLVIGVGPSCKDLHFLHMDDKVKHEQRIQEQDSQ